MCHEENTTILSGHIKAKSLMETNVKVEVK